MNIRIWLTVLVVASAIRAGTTYVELGTQYSGNYIPWWNYAGSMRWQTLYLQPEINRAGRIVSYAFRSYDGTSCTFNNVTVQMCHTAVTTLDSSFSVNYGVGTPETVFVAPTLQVGAAPNAWFVIPTGFDYNNRDNLLVEVTWDGASGFGAYMWTANLTPGNRRVFAYAHAASKGAPDWIATHARLGFVQGDVGCVRIIQPVGTVDSGEQVTPYAVVRNYGAYDARFGLRFRVSDGYDEARTGFLAAGATDSFEFEPWVARVLGAYVAVCSTELAGDTVTTNDAARDSVYVVPLQAVAEGPGEQPDAGLVVVPNPVTGLARVSYALPRAGRVRLELYAASGQRVMTLFDEAVSEGRHCLIVSPPHLARGLYFLRLESRGLKLMRRMVLE